MNKYEIAEAIKQQIKEMIENLGGDVLVTSFADLGNKKIDIIVDQKDNNGNRRKYKITIENGE